MPEGKRDGMKKSKIVLSLKGRVDESIRAQLAVDLCDLMEAGMDDETLGWWEAVNGRADYFKDCEVKMVYDDTVDTARQLRPRMESSAWPIMVAALGRALVDGKDGEYQGWWKHYGEAQFYADCESTCTFL
jgi:hypothetical protein